MFELIFSETYQDYKFTTTLRGKPKIVCNGYSYTSHIVYKDDPHKYWYCNQRWKKCKARGVLSPDGKLLLKGEHNHQPQQPTVLMFQDLGELTRLTI